MYANYHTHTTRCRHAKGEDREYIEAAIRSGIKVLGFSDHCPWVYPDDHVSGTRMPATQIDEYFSTMEKLKKEYENDIKIYIGFESEYIPELMEDQNRLFEQYPVDYMIMGEHFTGREPAHPYTGFPTEKESELKEYVDLVIEGLDTGKYKYLAHPDLMNYIGDRDIYDKHMTRLCQYLKEHDMPIEINLLGVYECRHYTSDRFMSIAKKVGNTAIIGIDAHSPDRLENKEAEELCIELANQYGIKLVETLPGLE